LLADALEAVIAAVYLDGGIEPVRHFVAAHILDVTFDGAETEGADMHPALTNFKSALQELAQSRKLPQPRYTTLQERGPEHAKTFTVEVRAGKDCAAQAEAALRRPPRSEPRACCTSA
jgi:ribonuclease-3